MGLYYIWSNEHKAWWKPGHAGYTALLTDVGTYSCEEALAICEQAALGWDRLSPMNELPVPVADMRELTGRLQ